MAAQREEEAFPLLALLGAALLYFWDSSEWSVQERGGTAGCGVDLRAGGLGEDELWGSSSREMAVKIMELAAGSKSCARPGKIMELGSCVWNSLGHQEDTVVPRLVAREGCQDLFRIKIQDISGSVWIITQTCCT